MKNSSAESLVDGLIDAGFTVESVNITRVIQYSGLKRTDDRSDAFHLAHLMRLGILPTGYIYPKGERGLHYLLRKRTKTITSPTFGDTNVQLALESNLRMSQLLSQQIKRVEKAIMSQVTPCISFELLKSTCGIGDVLAETIPLETGDIKRFKSPGNYASYCLCVDSGRMWNGKLKRFTGWSS